MDARGIFGGGVAVITGAGSGVGAGLARYADRLGMTVVLADVDGAAVAALREELSAGGGVAHDVVCDVRDPEAVQDLADRAYRDAGPVRLLVNNAGIEQFGYLWDTPVANWQRVMDVNVSGVFHGVRAFLPKMMATDDQAWVWNIASVGAVVAIPLQAPYIVSKHAVLSLTECLHLEVQATGHDHHIHVQAVLPGPVRSNIFESAGGVDPGAAGDAAAETNARPCSGSRRRPWIRWKPPRGSSDSPPRAASICTPTRTASARRWPSGPMCWPRNNPHDCGPRPGSNPHRTDVTAT